MSLARNVATVGAATLVSRVLGFARDVGVAALLGAGALADAFLAALQIPNLFRRLLSEGAVNAAFVPLWLRKRDNGAPESARRFGEEVLGTMLAGLAALALLGIVFAPWVVRLVAPGFEAGDARYALAVEFVRLSLAYIAIAGAVSIIAAVLNAEGRVAAVAFGIVMFNCISVAIVFALLASGATISERTGAILSAAVVVAGFGQLVVIAIAAMALSHAPRWPRPAASPDVARFFALALPGVVAASVPQLKLMTGAMIASSSQSAVSWLYYANRLYELPLGMISVAIATVLVPLIAKSVRNDRPADAAAAQAHGFAITLGLALPAAIGFAVLSVPIAGTLFERGAFGPRDTAAVAAALAAIAAGLPGHALEKMLGAVSFAHEDTRTPMLAALAGLGTAIAGALLFFPRHGHVGIAAAIAISGWVGASVLAVVLGRRGWLTLHADAWSRLIRIAAAAAAMGAAVFGAQQFAGPLATGGALMRIATLVVLIGGGLGVYLVLLHALDVLKVRDLVHALRRRT